jgi:hypothetical protein
LQGLREVGLSLKAASGYFFKKVIQNGNMEGIHTPEVGIDLPHMAFTPTARWLLKMGQ